MGWVAWTVAGSFFTAYEAHLCCLVQVLRHGVGCSPKLVYQLPDSAFTCKQVRKYLKVQSNLVVRGHAQITLLCRLRAAKNCFALLPC